MTYYIYTQGISLRKGDLMNTTEKKIQDLQNMISGFKCIDLAPLIEKGIPKWPTHPHLVIDPTVTHQWDGYYCQSINMAEHTAAHVDAPAHILADKMDQTIESFPANTLMGPAVKYDIKSLKPKPGQLITAEQLLALEEKSGAAVKKGEIALLNFGWEKYWKIGAEGKFYANNAPGFHESAAKFFSDRGVIAVGSDTVACDQALVDGVASFSYGHEVYWLPNKILMVECLMNLDDLPTLSYFIALPLKIQNGSGSPIRPIALIDA